MVAHFRQRMRNLAEPPKKNLNYNYPHHNHINININISTINNNTTISHVE